MSKRDDEIRAAIATAGRARDQKALMFALTALRDIADGKMATPAAIARKALADIEALSGDPFARIR